MLRRKLGPKRDEVIASWRKLHDEELHNLYSSPSVIRMTKSRRREMGRACNTNAENRNACRILVGKIEGKRPQGRSKRRWVDNIEMDLRWMGWGVMDFINLAR
jgi:hypothetical protein